MRTLRLSFAGALTVALLGGLSGAVVAQDDESATTAFPAGSFVSVDNNYVMLEFDEDGTGVSHNSNGGWHRPFTYAVDGDVFTWLTAEWTEWEYGQPTYSWHFDGERLAFELLGEDRDPSRRFVFADNTYTLAEDPHVVVVASRDIEAGDPVAVWASLGFVPTAEAGLDAYTDRHDVLGQVAVVEIPAGQPITPDLLEPAE